MAQVVLNFHSMVNNVCAFFADMKEVISEMVKQIQDLSSEVSDDRIELQLIGGYHDKEYSSNHIFSNAMRIFQSHKKKIDLQLACVGDFNTVFRDGIPWPIIYGVGVDLKTGFILYLNFQLF